VRALIVGLSAALAGCGANHSWRSLPPALPEAGVVASDVPIEVATLDDGRPAYLVRRSGDTAVVGLALRTGPGVDPALASFALGLVARGRDHAVEDALGELGGAAEVRWLVDGAVLRAEVDAGAWRTALTVLERALREPEFTEADLEELRAERVAALQRRDGDPARVALHVLAGRVAPMHDPLGDDRAVETWTDGHVREVLSRLAGGARAGIVVHADARLDARSRAAPSAVIARAAAEAEVRGEIVVVPRPGLPQTAIALGRVVPAVDADASLAIDVAGVAVASALRDVLRRDRGATYSVAVGYAPAASGGLLTIDTQVETGALGGSLRALVDRLRELQARFALGDQLSRVSRAIRVERVLACQRSETLADLVAGSFAAGRSTGELQDVLRGRGEVRGDAVQRAVRAYFEPARLQIVLVGDPERIAAQVGGLGLGPIRVLR
jgi:predicted Zn-dependent peptidase